MASSAVTSLLGLLKFFRKGSIVPAQLEASKGKGELTQHQPLASSQRSTRHTYLGKRKRGDMDEGKGRERETRKRDAKKRREKETRKRDYVWVIYRKGETCKMAVSFLPFFPFWETYRIVWAPCKGVLGKVMFLHKARNQLCSFRKISVFTSPGFTDTVHASVFSFSNLKFGKGGCDFSIHLSLCLSFRLALSRVTSSAVPACRGACTTSKSCTPGGILTELNSMEWAMLLRFTTKGEEEENTHDKKGKNWLHGNSCVLMDSTHGTKRESSHCIDNSHCVYLQRVAEKSLRKGTYLHLETHRRANELRAVYLGNLESKSARTSSICLGDLHARTISHPYLRNSFTAANPSPLYPPEMGSLPKGVGVGEGEQSLATQSDCINPDTFGSTPNVFSEQGNVICKYNRDCCEIIINFVIDQREICILLENSIHKDFIYGKEPATGGMGVATCKCVQRAGEDVGEDRCV
ncbi:hypothetical protein POVWA1_036680 [Plasmodium ovale wallikeri]|uniref:Uncharacterized protein n=1 Tax=Plasmodium ovale wallikeri TaxID=864142 RepID=A0A1A8Z287_PLAOA|nr:hypothetical protein POVWA1_036680 [Plasmodium ovale wallikeri]